MSDARWQPDEPSGRRRERDAGGDDAKRDDTGGDRPRSDSGPQPADRLDSWKEIAAYLDRSVRTVQRWEKEEGLPVRRHLHQKMGTVYAHPGEIDEWLRQREVGGGDLGTAAGLPGARGAGGVGEASAAPGRRSGERAQGESAQAARRSDEPSVAVLPFASMSPDAGDEYFCDGMTEELINVLTKVEGLQVASRTSVFQYKGAAGDIQEIGHRLNVDAVLEGSVRRSGDRIRVTAQMVDVDSGFHLWSETFERELEDIFAIEDEICGAIVDKLRVTLDEHPRAATASRRTADPDAYQAYLRGRHFQDRRTPAALDRAVECFEEALEHDPDYGLAWAGLADAYNLLGYHGHRPPKEVFPRAKEAARRALEIDDTLAEAHASLGFSTMFYDRDWVGAGREFERALELEPGYPTAHYWYGIDLAAQGRPFDAATRVRRARELDPLSPLINTYSAGALYFARQYDQALERCRATLELAPDYALAHVVRGWILRQQGRHEEAIASLRRALELAPESVDALAFLGHAQAVAGDAGAAEEVLAELDERAEDRYVSAGHRAVIHAGLGRADAALDWLDRAYEERYAWLVFLRVDPVYDALRGEPRFVELLERIGV